MYDPKIHHRHSIRIKDYDYSKKGMYFITICTKEKKHIFGNINNEEVILSNIGKIAKTILNKVEKKLREKISVVEYIIMPNHVHLIVELKLDYKIKLKDFITLYKSLVTKKVNKEYKNIGCIWQRNYYEHIIRNEKEMFAIIEYIQTNPIRWNKN